MTCFNTIIHPYGTYNIPILGIFLTGSLLLAWVSILDTLWWTFNLYFFFRVELIDSGAWEAMPCPSVGWINSCCSHWGMWGVLSWTPFLSDKCTDPNGTTPHQSEIQTNSKECQEEFQAQRERCTSQEQGRHLGSDWHLGRGFLWGPRIQNLLTTIL